MNSGLGAEIAIGVGGECHQLIVLINFTFCLYKCFFLLLTKATTQAVHILSHPSLGVGKIICSLVEAAGDAAHMSVSTLHVRTGQIVTKEERDGDRELRAKQPSRGKWGGSGPALELQILT